MGKESWIADARESYDRVAARYAEVVVDGVDSMPVESALVDLFTRQAADRGDLPLLDVGCGPGVITRRLGSTGMAAVGVDPSKEMLRLARINSPGTMLVAGSITGLPVADASVAGVFCWYVLHHVPDDDLPSAIAELARVTTPGGRLMVGGHVGSSSHLKTDGYGGLPMRVLVARRPPEVYADLMRAAGLVVDATVALGPGGVATEAVWLAHRPK